MNNFDGLNPNDDQARAIIIPKRMSKLKKLTWFVIIFLILGGIGWGVLSVLSKTNKIFTNHKSIFTRVGRLLASSDQPLKGEDNGLVNVLLLGIGGEGHDGAYLTDTMIVASINVKTNEVVLTSIPRDWVYTIPKHGLNKINAVYAYALQDNPNDPNAAGNAAIKAAEEVTGFTIPYYAVVDFKGFVQAVDHVGGVTVTVDRTFSDATFPNDFPFDTKGVLGNVTFYKGTQHMDGRTALIFARSRHGTNDEGSDFARSERQKKIIDALKEKLLGLNVTNVATLNKLLTDFSNNFRTNLEPYELLRLANIGKQVTSDNTYSLSLEPQGTTICDTTVDQITGNPYIHPVETPTPDPTTSTTPTSSTSTTTKTPVTSPTGTKTKTLTPTPTPTPTVTPTPSPTPTPVPTPTPELPKQIPMYIVRPCNGKTLADVHQLLVDFWDVARLKKEGATIEIQNSTGKSSASVSWKKLADFGITVSTVPFSGKVPFEKTILYDNSGGSKPKTLEYLHQHYQFTTADIKYTNTKANFVIIIGSDSL